MRITRSADFKYRLMCHFNATLSAALAALSLSGTQYTVAASLPDPAAYDIIEISSLPGNDSEARAINNRGQVVGFSMNGAGCCAQGFRWPPQPPNIFLDQLTYANGINGLGIMTGQKDVSGGGGKYLAFRGIPGLPLTVMDSAALVALGFKDSKGLGYSEGVGINSSKNVVGNAYPNASGTRDAIIWYASNNKVERLPVPNNSTSFANSVNDVQEVVGLVDTEHSPDLWRPGHAFYWNALTKTFKDLNATDPHGHHWVVSQCNPTVIIPGTESFALDFRTATAINSHRQIVGFGGATNPPVIRAYRLRPLNNNPGHYCFDNLHTLSPHGGISLALGMNRGDAVVGAAYLDASGAGNNVAALFTHTRVVNLESLLSRLDRLHWSLAKATGINDNGEIVGYGVHDTLTRAFILKPHAHISVTASGGGAAALITVKGAGFFANAKVRIEIRPGDIGGEPLQTSAIVAANTQGAVTLTKTIPCGRIFAINAWDQTSGAYSNAQTANVPCVH
jgi:uncharacterized membrane protein